MSAPLPPARPRRLAVQSSRHWPVVVPAALLGLILGIAGSSVLPSTYAARSTVSARAITVDAQELARSRHVAEAAEPDSDVDQRSTDIQVDALATRLARLSSIDATPGQIVGTAQEATRVGPGAVLLGVAGAMLGLLVGILLVRTRTKRRRTTLGRVEDITSLGDHLVLDGRHDLHRSDTWTIAACVLRLPEDLRSASFVIMLDADGDPRAAVAPGHELVDALARCGRTAQLVDTSRINEGKIYRGWPTVTNRSSWRGSIVVLDTTALTSDALKIALAARADSVILARSTNDDAAALRRLTALMRRGNASVDLTALFPPRRRRFWRR